MVEKHELFCENMNFLTKFVNNWPNPSGNIYGGNTALTEVRNRKLEMRHRISLRKLGRDSKERMTLFKNLVSNLFKHERIVTTLPKGKELRRISDKVNHFTL